MKRVLVCGCLLIFAPLDPRAEQPLRMSVSPAAAFAPASVMVRARIETHAENRELRVIADSDVFSRASYIPLDGERAPRVNELIFRDLPAGEYQVRVTLMGPRGPRAVDWRPLYVGRSLGR
jgi:hypothetical protein